MGPTKREQQDPHFHSGERVFIREVLDGRVWTVRPVTILHDDEFQTISWLAPGTLIEYPRGVEHGEKCLNMWLSGEWSLETKEYYPPGALRIAPAREPFEVFAPVTESGVIEHWYVNFQRPLSRTSLGFDTMDEIVDLIVSSDLRTWERKDEDELDLALSMGFFSHHDVTRLRESCARVEERLRRGDVPWDHHGARVLARSLPRFKES